MTEIQPGVSYGHLPPTRRRASVQEAAHRDPIRPAPTPGELLRARPAHRPLMMFAGLMVVTGLVSAGGLLLDDRMLLGAPIWLKPFKFSVSLCVYAITWAWMLSLSQRPRRWIHRTGTAVALLLTLEMVIIIGQAVRGRMSHFNAASPFDAALFAVMGASIAAVWVLNLIQAVVLMRERLADRAMDWAIRLGTAISLAGMAVAFLMTPPTAEQRAAMSAGKAVTATGAHSVGVPDGGPGLPITGWSTVGGDLRVPHFIGLHALQALPLLAVVLVVAARRLPRLHDDGVRLRLIAISSAAYVGLVALTTWQALRGQPLTGPDSWTLGALALIVAGSGIATAIALGRARPAPTRERQTSDVTPAK
jgi:hypothetical protein